MSSPSRQDQSWDGTGRDATPGGAITEGMCASILNVTFDCSDAGLVARFWSEVIGWPSSRQDMPGNPFWLVAQSEDSSPRLVYVEVPESKGVKNRVHLDLIPSRGSQQDEEMRNESLGARIVDDRRGVDREGGSSWRTPRETSSASRAAGRDESRSESAITGSFGRGANRGKRERTRTDSAPGASVWAAHWVTS